MKTADDLIKLVQSFLSRFIFLLLGLIVGVTGALSFLRTQWDVYQLDFFFWWSIVSTLVGFFFVVFSLWQYWGNRSQVEKNKAQIKVWMQDANGIRNAIQRVVRDNFDGRYSSTNDMGNAIWSIEANAGSLYQSLYEERCVTEEEYRARQKKIGELLDKKQFAQLEREARLAASEDESEQAG